MLTRMRLLRGATALLYIGPLLAGLCGFGWGMVAAFVAIFVVWLMVLRPEQWPATPDEWLTGQAWLAALSQVLSQVLLVAVLFGIGRGFGGIAGFLPMVSPYVPLTLSFLAIPLCRMLWDAREAADQGYFLDDEAAEAHAPRALVEAGTAIVPLLNLPDNAKDADVSNAVVQSLDVSNPEVRLRALAAALDRPARSHAALRRGLLLWISEPEVVAPGHVPNAMALALAFAGKDPDLLRMYAPRALALIAAFPDRAADFPAPEELRDAAALAAGPAAASDLPRHLLDDLRDGLNALAKAVEKALDTGPVRDDAPKTDARSAARVAGHA
jgi:hypothetical protein